jgi:catechol 2,3-dioxygenase-like lactoylglutathione lyase family enzyme
MSSTSKVRDNVKQAVPFFMVKDIDSSVNFYVNGLGFSMTESWVDQGKLKWCWLVIDNAALMLQEFRKETVNADWPEGKPGDGIEIFFICEDALAIYEQITLNGILAAEPFVGNKMWVVSLKDPDGYKISFESFTDVPEETKYSQWKNTKQHL